MLQRYWYDTRVRAGLTQVLLLALFLGVLGWFIGNTQANLARRGMDIDFGFFGQAARFPISESVLPYTPADSFGYAFLLGLINTLTVAAIVICLATVFGFLLAIARRSAHPLLSGLASGYIEIIRNTPLIVHVLFWYVLVITTLPNVRQAYEPLPHVFLSIRGIFVPSFGVEGGAAWLAWLVLVLLVAGSAALLLPFSRRRLHPLVVTLGWPGLAIVSVALLGLGWLIDGLTFRAEVPELRGLNFRGGITLTPEFAALVISLVVYKVAFIAEIFRGGIEAVAKGQWEAGRALGLRDGDTLRKVILPQALRIIVPPMASQYLTTVKNTTVALAIGYPDLSAVVSTVINQSGRALEGFAVMIAVYLTISIAVASFMNWYNRRINQVSVK